MVKLTKAQKKRMVREIESKAKKLYLLELVSMDYIVTVKDMDAIEKMCKKWMKRIG